MNLSEFKLEHTKPKKRLEIEEVSGKDIAIIGMAVRFPMAESVNDFWKILRDGTDCVRDLPPSRWPDIEAMLTLSGKELQNVKFGQAAYLDEVDQFDFSFFRISPKEASLMDPNQRLFLETAWQTIEDAGYGGRKLLGSRTGVYVGYGSETDYKRMIAAIDPNLLSVAVPGNSRPIIASRLSYLLDLHGPSMIVDTTCSSSLLAVHLACRGIRSGECEQAIAGGVQIHLLPFRESDIGIEASDGRAKSFDESSDGTGTGEGVAAVFLKSLTSAMRDGDHIYAVIKGSAVNHDGNSIGITAPNALAQEDVMVNAWQDAGINPETINCIEAHGTGTKLGDPIEIDGIQKALGRFTTKKQFCAIGSVKTNIGHLDNSAGIAGLIKAVLAIEHGQIPPSLHFNYPNRKINFAESPIYVVDRLKDWKTDGFPRRCGVSSFGLSGTNCHLVIEEYTSSRGINSVMQSPEIIAISAKSENVLLVLLAQYRDYINNNNSSNLADICFTANTGRGHYNCRLALIVKDIDEFRYQIDQLLRLGPAGVKNGNVFYGKHQVISVDEEQAFTQQPDSSPITLITESDVKRFSAEIQMKLREIAAVGNNRAELLPEICRLYIQGSEVDWTLLYEGETRFRVNLPVYPFEKKRCWFDAKKALFKKPEYDSNCKQLSLPLLDCLVVQTMDSEIYVTDFAPDKHWVLNEHKIAGECVLVGTTYLEMVLEAIFHQKTDGVEFRDITFISPLVIPENDSRPVQLVIKQGNGFQEFNISSKTTRQIAQGNNWALHVTGKIYPLKTSPLLKLDLETLKQKHQAGYMVPDIDHYNEATIFEFGPRWKNLKEIYVGETELLSHLSIPESFHQELKQYVLYPSLLDNALATIPLLRKVFADEPDSIFLPFSYQKFKIYQPLPVEFYSLVRLINDPASNREIASFNISLIDNKGNIFAEIEEYTVKKTTGDRVRTNETDELANLSYQTTWTSEEIPDGKDLRDEVLVLFKDRRGIGEQLTNRLLDSGNQVIVVEIADSYSKIDDQSFLISNHQADYSQLFRELKERRITRLIHMLSVSNHKISTVSELEDSLDSGVMSLFRIVKALLQEGYRDPLQLVLVSETVNKVSGTEELLRPEHATLFGLGKVVEAEYPQFKCKAVDIDIANDVLIEQSHIIDLNISKMANNIYQELESGDHYYQVAYRQGERLVEGFAPVKLATIPDNPMISLKEDGVYLITGGTGGIGLEIAKYLGNQAKINLALVNRSSMPESKDWDQIVSANLEPKWIDKITKIREINELGSKVFCYSADVANEDEMRQLIKELHNKFGRINGIIHSAGLPGDSFLIKKSEADFIKVLNPKVKGTWVLDYLTTADNPEFFIMFSSNNTLMGIPGQGDYTAANSFLVSYAAFRQSQTGKALAINWPAWKEIGMAAEYGVNFDSIFKTINNRQAIAAFGRVIHKDTSNIIIGELNQGGSFLGKTIQDARLKISSEIMNLLNRIAKDPSRSKNDDEVIQGKEIVLQGKNQQDYTETEQEIAKIWRDILGFEELNVYQNFFEIGGDSILITKVHAQLDQKFPGKVSIADLFTYTTISKLSKYLNPQVEPTTNEGKTIKNEAEVKNDIEKLIEEMAKGNVSLDKALKDYHSM